MSALVEIGEYLDQLEGNALLTVTAGLGFAIAFPKKTVSSNLFAHGYTEIVVTTDIADNVDVRERYENSVINMLAFGYAEIGLSLAKEFTILEEKISLGIAPKYQKMTTYAQHVSVVDFDIEDYDESENTENALNFDLGAIWYKNNFRVGLAVKDLLKQKIEAKDNNLSDTYKLNTQITLGFAYASDYFTAALDADLTKQARFQNIDDDTQFVRVGMEGNAWGWAQLRAGYEIDLEDTIDNAITAGIGISPFDVVSVDIAGSYIGDNQFGASAGLAFTF